MCKILSVYLVLFILQTLSELTKDIKQKINPKHWFWMVTLRIIHATNQPPWPKTVAYRPRTDRQIHRQTDRQTEKVNTEDPFFYF